MPAGRPKGVKNRRPVGEEYVKKAARHRAEARLARVVPYDLDTNEKLDPMAASRGGDAAFLPQGQD